MCFQRLTSELPRKVRDHRRGADECQVVGLPAAWQARVVAAHATSNVTANPARTYVSEEVESRSHNFAPRFKPHSRRITPAAYIEK